MGFRGEGLGFQDSGISSKQSLFINAWMAPSLTPLLGVVGGLVMAAYHGHVNHGAKDLLYRVVATTL